jgi:hypothetical protein
MKTDEGVYIYSSTVLKTRHYVEVCRQRHASAILLPWE